MNRFQSQLNDPDFQLAVHLGMVNPDQDEDQEEGEIGSQEDVDMNVSEATQ